MTCRPSPHRAQAGASLLEVLVAVLILSFGMLAAAGLTATALQYAKMSQFQAVGMQLANELGDRMRANRSGFTNNLYNRTGAYTGASTVATGEPACAGAACTAAEIAAIDLFRWVNNLRRQLPAGDAYVLRDTGANTWAADLWILWQDPNLQFGSTSTDALAIANPCPNFITVSAGVQTPRCMYYRISQ
jgi:type IV pilus assembly protein PilV